MKQDNFAWLQKWYYLQCDGDWEHTYGIDLKTLENPGWFLKINLEDTELENKHFQGVEIERSKRDWLFCGVNNNEFEATCSIDNLSEVLKIFRDWVLKR